MMAKLAIKKVQYGIDREAAKILVLSTDKIDLCENLTSKKILSSHQSRKTGQARFLYSPLAKVFEKEKKKSWNPRAKQIKAIEGYEKQLVDSNALNKKNWY